MKMCQAFSKQGLDVYLLTPDWKAAEAYKKTDEFEFYDIDRCFSIVKIHLLPGKGNIPSYMLGIANQLRRLKPDIVYGRWLFGCFISAILGFITVFETHAPVWRESSLARVSLKVLLKNKNLKAFFVISHALRRKYENIGYISHDRINVLPTAADEVKPHVPISRWPGRKNSLQIGYVGHLYPGKGMEVVDKIAALLPNSDFHVIGGMEKDIAFWKERSNHSNILFHGFVTQDELSGYFDHLDICLLPNQKTVRTSGWSGTKKDLNIGDYTSPMKMFQYMAHRKAIVASNLPVIQEVLTSQNSILVDPEDTQAWVDAINSLENKSLRNKIASNAYDNFMKNYRWEERAEQVIKIIYKKPSPMAH